MDFQLPIVLFTSPVFLSLCHIYHCLLYYFTVPFCLFFSLQNLGKTLFLIKQLYVLMKHRKLYQKHRQCVLSSQDVLKQQIQNCFVKNHLLFICGDETSKVK